MVAITRSNIPDEFLCPLTNTIMMHPLMTRDGRSFERSEIVRWITSRNGPTCPITMKPLHVKDLVPNHNLRIEIQSWREQRGEIVKPNDNETEAILEDEVWKAIALALKSHQKKKKFFLSSRFKRGDE